jgi:hypothetical protein
MTGHVAREPEGQRTGGTGERRVTVDLDDAVPLDLYRAWSVLEDAGCYDLAARVSSGGEGFHVRGWVDADDLDAEQVERVRYLAGDHPRRVRMDRLHRSKPQQVLFTRKGDAEAGPWHTDPWEAADDLRRRSSRGPWSGGPNL